jgi:hypothetical protein
MYEEGLLGKMYDVGKKIACVAVAVGSLLMPGCGGKPVEQPEKKAVPAAEKSSQYNPDTGLTHVPVKDDPIEDKFIFGKYKCDSWAKRDVEFLIRRELKQRNRRMQDLSEEERTDLLNSVGLKMDTNGDGFVRFVEYNPRNGFRYDHKTETFSIGKYKFDRGLPYEPIDFVVRRELKRIGKENVEDLTEEERTEFLNAIGRKMDKNGDFVISSDEADEYVRPIWEAGESKTKQEPAFDREAAMRELAERLVNMPGSIWSTHEAAARFIMEKADKNDNGLITEEELEQFEKESPWMTDAEMKASPHYLINLALKFKDKAVGRKEDGSVVYTIAPERLFVFKDRSYRIRVIYQDKDGDGKPSAGDEVAYTLQIGAANVIGEIIRTFRDRIEEGEYAYTSLSEFSPAGLSEEKLEEALIFHRQWASVLLLEELKHLEGLEREE